MGIQDERRVDVPVFLPDKPMGTYFIKLLDDFPVTPYLSSSMSFMKWVHFMNNKLIRKDVLCRVCSSNNIETVVKLNDTPLEDQFVDKANKHNEQRAFPLELAICKDCGYMHLPHIVSPEVSYVDYLYKSSTTPGLGSHYDQYAKE
mgnify:CR=1 FL=1